jgi:hypothetical protein
MLWIPKVDDRGLETDARRTAIENVADFPAEAGVDVGG